EDNGFPRGDLEKARELVEQYERETGERLRFRITTTPEPDTIRSVELAAKMFEDAGMDVSITTFEQSALIQTAIEKNYQLMAFRNYPGLDPDGNYVWWYDGETNPVNFSGYSDPEVNELLDAGRATADREERQEIYAELNRELSRDGYYIWTNWTRWAVQKQHDLHGDLGARPTAHSP